VVTLCYRMLEVGVGYPKIERRIRPVSQSKGTRNSFQECANFIVEVYGRAQDGRRQILWRNLQPVLQQCDLQEEKRTELGQPGTQPGAHG